MLGLRGLHSVWCRSRIINTRRSAVLAAVGGKSAGRRGKKHALEEDANYWEHVLTRIQTTKPALIAEMGEILDPSIHTGLDPDVLTAKGLAKPSMHAYVMELKSQYPQAVILNQSGNFYDIIGIDAMVAVDVLGINWKSPGGKVPLAGIPVRNLPDQLGEFMARGFSVVVANQVEPNQTSSKKNPGREVAFISTPASPIYLASQTGRRTNVTSLPPPPKLGIAYGKNGCTLYALNQETNTVTVHAGLTLEGLLCQINAVGIAPPILFHSSFDETEGRKLLAILLKRLEKEVSTTSAPLKASFAGADACKAFINEVRVSIYRNADVAIKLASVDKGDRPRPPYLSTVMQLGLSPHSLGAPSLLDAAISLQAPATCRNWLRTLLLTPPPYKQAAQIQAAVAEVLSCQEGKYRLELGLQSDMIMRVLQTQGKVPLKFFRQLTSLAASIAAYLGSPAHKGMIDAVLAYCLWESQLTAFGDNKHLEESGTLRQELLRITENIHAVVNLDFVADSSGLSSDDEMMAEEPAVDSPSKKSRFYEPVFKVEREAQNMENLKKFRNVTESTIYSVQRNQMPFELEQVEKTFQRYADETNDMFQHYYRQWAYPDDERNRPFSSKGAPEVAYFPKAQMAAFKLPRNSKLMRPQKAALAVDRQGQLIQETITTQTLENHCRAYFAACEKAHEQASKIITQLCNRLSETESRSSLLLAARMSVVLEALFQHVQHVHTQDWCLPELSLPSDLPPLEGVSTSSASQRTSHSSSSSRPASSARPASDSSALPATAPLSLTGLRPYYLGATDAAVPNDVEMHNNVWLLTGANMAGKSTVLRSIAAASLLGVCGLMVPASHAYIPAFDAIMLRNSSGDSAMEGKSSFKMETDDIGTVLQESSARSLVLADELGKGTEVDSGTAIAAELAEWMVERRCTTVLATHLHDLITELAELEAAGRVVFMRMGLRSSSSTAGLEPTWKLEQGVCTESLAVEVARSSGLPEEFLQQAERKRARLRARRARLEALDQGGEGEAGGSSSSSRSRSKSRSMEEGGRGASEASSSTGSCSCSSSVESVMDSMKAGSGPAVGVEGGDGCTSSPAAPLVEPAVSPKAVSKAQFDAAVEILLSTARRIEEETRGQAGSSIFPSSVYHLSPMQEVPPLHASGGAYGSAVYLCHYPKGEVYCGQSKSLQRRLKDHRKQSVKDAHKGPETSLSYVLVSPDLAKRIETSTIKALRAAGIPLTSAKDEHNRSF